jgi:hypothetical protein
MPGYGSGCGYIVETFTCLMDMNMDRDKDMPRYDVECNYKDTRNAENV